VGQRAVVGCLRRVTIAQGELGTRAGSERERGQATELVLAGLRRAGRRLRKHVLENPRGLGGSSQRCRVVVLRVGDDRERVAQDAGDDRVATPGELAVRERDALLERGARPAEITRLTIRRADVPVVLTDADEVGGGELAWRRCLEELERAVGGLQGPW